MNYLKEACDNMDVGASRGHKHTNCQAGVHILQVHLGGMRSAKKDNREQDMRDEHLSYIR